MDKAYLKRLGDLIRTDLITVRGSGKNNTLLLAVIASVLFGTLGIICTPLMGIYVPMLLGLVCISTLYGSEQKYHCAKMFAVLPIERKDLVRSRFITSCGLYIASAGVFYILMFLSLKLKIYIRLGVIDIIGMFTEKLTGFSETGFLNLIYSASFSFGLTAASNMLHNYFKNSKSLSNQIEFKKLSKSDIKNTLIAFVLIIVVVLAVTDVLPITAALAPVIQIIASLARAADGFLLGALLVTISGFSAVYNYICSLLEYDEKEL